MQFSFAAAIHQKYEKLRQQWKMDEENEESEELWAFNQEEKILSTTIPGIFLVLYLVVTVFDVIIYHSQQKFKKNVQNVCYKVRKSTELNLCQLQIRRPGDNYYSPYAMLIKWSIYDRNISSTAFIHTLDERYEHKIKMRGMLMDKEIREASPTKCSWLEH